MSNIHIDKETCALIDRHRLMYRLLGNTTLNRKQMMKLLIEHGDKSLAEVPLSQRTEKGLICVDPTGEVDHSGAMAWPDPQALCDIINETDRRLLIVYGPAGSGVSTYLKSLVPYLPPDVAVFDTARGNVMNITSARLAFDEGHRVIAAVGADNYHGVLLCLQRYTSEEWLNSWQGREVLALCQQG